MGFPSGCFMFTPDEILGMEIVCNVLHLHMMFIYQMTALHSYHLFS